MISNTIAKSGASRSLYSTLYYAFSVQKKPRMEFTIRTPYQTIIKDFDGVQRAITKTNEAALVIQNKFPPSAYVIPPGHLKLKFSQDVKDTSGDYLHLGGWVTIHPDNTCEINLLDCFDRKEIRPDQFDKGEALKDLETNSGRYMSKLRKSASRIFAKKATQ